MIRNEKKGKQAANKIRAALKARGQLNDTTKLACDKLELEYGLYFGAFDMDWEGNYSALGNPHPNTLKNNANANITAMLKAYRIMEMLGAEPAAEESEDQKKLNALIGV